MNWLSYLIAYCWLILAIITNIVIKKGEYYAKTDKIAPL